MAITFLNSLAVGTDVLYVDAVNDRVGIGTSSPQSDGTSGSEQYRGGIGYNHSNDELFIVSGGSTKATMDSSGNLDVSGTIRSSTNEGKLVLNSTATNGKEYQFISIDSGNLGLFDGTAYRLWVAGSGNVGIGTTSPDHKFCIFKD